MTTHVRQYLFAASVVVASVGLVPRAAHGLSIDVSQSTLQARLVKDFPKEVPGLVISQPVITLEGAASVAVLCGRWKASNKLLDRVLAADLPRDGKFCAESGLKWNAESSAVSLTRVRVRSLTLGLEQAMPPMALKTLNATLPRLVEGVVVYDAPTLAGWLIKDLRVMEGRLRLDF